MRYLFGDYVLDTQRYELHGAGAPVKLRRKVFQVLAYLLAHRDRVIPKQELLEHLWPDQFVGDDVLKACMLTLRKALGERGRAPRFIRTLHGQGYRFVAAVAVREHLPADDASHALPSHASPRSEAGGDEGEGENGSGPQQLPPVGIDAWDGEHKQVTVLCGALADAPTLAACLGPEAMYYLMRDVLALAQDTVQRYDGTLLQVSGEGFLALFGAPVAQEDHARRAVLAALALRQRLHAPDALRGQPHGVALRLGLHTGPVVVGSLEHDSQRPYIAGGDTLALATRLQHQAAPDTLLLSAATYALVQAEVQGAAWAAGPSDAVSPPVVWYVVHGLLRRRAGVPRRGGRPLSPLVGRARELALLHERLALAASGQGQVVGMAGEPGMGKSRLLAEFAHSLNGQPVTYCDGHCLAYGRATPYGPVRDLLRQLWGLSDTAAPDAITATIQQRLHAAGIVAEDGAPLLLQLLDVPGEAAALAALDPQGRRARTFALLRQLVLHASQRQPLVLAVENLHWIDPTSDEWLAALAARLGGTAILLLATYRPGYRLPWLAHSWATQVALPPLTSPDSLAVVQAVPQAARLSARQHQTIVAQAAGNPFFLEELAWAAVAHGDDARPLLLPDTIQAVLAARLDRLPPEAKRLLQIAAVMGPEVPVPLLQRLAGLAEETLQCGLAHLQGVELLYETRLFPDPVYTFKHALTHQVAYSSLLQERRRALHAQIVEALETLGGDRQDEQVDRLAQHALQGEVWDKALAYFRQAGEKAMVRSAHREAVGSFEQALRALPHLPETRDTRAQAIDLRLALRSALHTLGDFGRVLAVLREAESLAEALGDSHRLGQVSSFLSIQFWYMGAYDQAIAAGQRALALATASGDVALHAVANRYLGLAYVSQGDYRRAIDCLKQTVASLEGTRRYERFGQTSLPAVQSRAQLAAWHAELGMFTEGIALGDEGLRMAEAIAHPASLLHALWGGGMLALRQGDLPRAIPRLERAMGICQEADLSIWFLQMAASLGEAYTLGGRIADAVPLLTQALEQATPMERVSHQRGCRLSLGQAHLLAGRLEEAQALAKQVLVSFTLGRQGGGYQVYALRLLGEIAARRDAPESEQAESYYRQALTLADERGMRPLQAHCHLGLGTLYATTGQREQARAALTTAIDLYRAMDMTFWLPQTEAALVQVEGQ